MIEKSYVMIKPGFVCKEVIEETINYLESKGIKLIDESYLKYDEETATLHYIEKKSKPYIKELTDYLSSDISYGMVFEGENCLYIARTSVEELRNIFKEKFSFKTDVMRNYLHCSSKTKVHDTYLELDTQRELALFFYLKEHKKA